MTNKRLIFQIHTKSFDKSKRKNSIKLETNQMSIKNKRDKWKYCGIFIHGILYSNEKNKFQQHTTVSMNLKSNVGQNQQDTKVYSQERLIHVKIKNRQI